MGEAQPIIPLLVMWQRTLRIRQCMRQEELLQATSDAQDMTTPQAQIPTSAEQTLELFCQQAPMSIEEVEGHDERLWWEKLVQSTNWAQWDDRGDWTDWTKR